MSKLIAVLSFYFNYSTNIMNFEANDEICSLTEKVNYIFGDI